MTEDPHVPVTAQQRWVRGVAVAFFLGVLALAVLYGRREGVSIELLRDWVEVSGLWGPLVYLLVAILAAVLLVPATAVMAIGALLFPVLLALPVVWLGGVLGSVACFALARSLGRDAVARLLRGRFAAWDQSLRGRGFKVLFLLRVAGFPPFNILNYAAGLANVRLRDATAATALGTLPLVVVVVLLVDRIGRAPTPGAVATDPVFWIALALVVLLVFLPRLARRRTRRAVLAPPVAEGEDDHR